MSRPSLAEHATRLALLEQSAAHNGAAMLEALHEIRDEVKSLRADFEQEVATMKQKHHDLDKAISEAKALARGFGSGWAAAFMLIGGAVGTAVANFMGLFK